MDRGGDLAVGPLALGAAVLTLHADGELALLGEAGVVDHEDPGGRGEGPGHGRAVSLPDGPLVPGALADELLQRLVQVLDLQAGRECDLAGERLDTLAVAVEDETLEVDAGVLGLAGPVEVAAESVGVGGEPVEDFGGEFGGVGSVHALD